MKQIELLNIPNFYSSYYLLALSEVGDLKFKPSSDFEEFNNRGFLIFKIGGKLGVVDNHDPVGVNEILYKEADFYFATNKLKSNSSYNQKKVKPLFPHYPVNIIGLYLKIFGTNLLVKLNPKALARELYILNSRNFSPSLDS